MATDERIMRSARSDLGFGLSRLSEIPRPSTTERGVTRSSSLVSRVLSDKRRRNPASRLSTTVCPLWTRPWLKHACAWVRIVFVTFFRRTLNKRRSVAHAPPLPSLSRYDTYRLGPIILITRTDSSTFRKWKGGGDSASSHWYRRLCR